MLCIYYLSSELDFQMQGPVIMGPHTSNRGEKETVRPSHSVALRPFMTEDRLVYDYDLRGTWYTWELNLKEQQLGYIKEALIANKCFSNPKNFDYSLTNNVWKLP